MIAEKDESQPTDPDWLHAPAMINSTRLYNYINKTVASNKKVISALRISLKDEKFYSVVLGISMCNAWYSSCR